MARRFRKPNPQQEDGISTNTILILGLGTALLGAIAYAVYQISQTNAAIADASQSAAGVGEQIGSAAVSGQSAADQIAALNQQIQDIQNSALYQRLNQGLQ
jgi:ABC-type transporter Mla subunit MlaD